MDLAIILFISALVVLVWLFLWAFQRERLNESTSGETTYSNLPVVSGRDGVLIVDARGRLTYTNDTLRGWLRASTLTVESVAGCAEPVDAFFDLLSGETQVTLQLNRRWLQAESRRITEQGEQRTIVVLREIVSAGDASTYDPQIALAIIDEIGETVTAAQGVEPVLQALLTIVRKRIPADAGEITLWDDREHLLIPRGYIGDAMYVLALAEAGGVYRESEGISGWIATRRQPVLVTDATAADAVRPKLPEYRSFIGIPLTLGDRFVGTFELAAKTPGAFDTARLAVLQNIARPIATAIVNAELYAQQAQRVSEIADVQSVVDQQMLIDNPEAVFGALAERAARLLDAQMAGTLLYDEQRERLIPALPFHGLPAVLIRNFSINVPEGSAARAIWQEREYWIAADISDEPTADDLELNFLYNTAGVRSTLLMPLTVGARRVGMLALFNRNSPTGFSDRDARTLRPLAAQVAIAVENRRLAEQERIRETEMAGLQEISQVFSAMAHTDEFYRSITDRLARLMNVEICGVLLDDGNGSLLAQPPFYGMDAADYAIPYPPDGALSGVLNQEGYWFTNAVATDRLVYSAEIAELTAINGIYKLLMVTLPAAGQQIGVVQVANPADGRDFTDDDARLLGIYAAQVGAVIENARLFRAVQEQVDVSESIRRIAEYAGAVNTPDDSFHPLLREAARLLNSPQSFINVIDPVSGNLMTYPQYVYQIDLPETLVFDAYTQGFEYSVAVSRRVFISNHLADDRRVLPGYRRFTDRFGFRSVLMVPLVVGEQSLGEIGVLNRMSGEYDEDDARLLSAIAVHVAAALDRVRLAVTTGQNMRRRLQELDAISRVSNELAQTLDLDQTLGVIRHEAIRALEAIGSIVLLLPASEWRSPEQPTLDRRIGERMSGLAAIELAAMRAPGAIIVDDYQAAGDLPAKPEYARSAIAVAFSYEENIVGVIHLWNEHPGHFDILAGTFLETLAAKASLAFGNNRRYLENQERANRLARRVEQLNQIFELGQVLQSTADTLSVLEAIAFSVGQSIGYDIVIMLMMDETGERLERVTQAGLPLDAFEASRHLTLSRDRLEALFDKTAYRISESYFFPFSKLTDWYVEGMEVFGSGIAITRTMHPRGKTDWHDGDMLIVPLRGAGGDLLGVMSLDRPYDGRRPDRAVIEILEVFAHQAATTLQNNQLFASSVQNAQEEARLNQVLAAISSTFDLVEIVRGVATGTIGMIPVSRMTVALFTSGGRFDLIRVEQSEDGEAPLRITRENRVNLASTALGKAFESGQETLYTLDHPHTDEELLRDLAVWRAAGEGSSLILPLVAGGLVLGALHIGSADPSGALFAEQGTLIRRVASLTGIAVQNARLFTDTRARTERLSLLNRVSTALSQSLDTENVMEIALQEIAQLLDMPISRAYLVEREMGVIRAVVDFPRGDSPPEDLVAFGARPLFDRVIQSAKPILYEDLSQIDPGMRPQHLEHPETVVAYALLPMVMVAQVTGIFELTSSEPARAFDPEKLELAEVIGSQAAIGVLNASLLEQTLVRTRELETLLEATQATAYTLDLDDVLRSVTRLALQALDLQDAVIMLYDNIEDALVVQMEFHDEDALISLDDEDAIDEARNRGVMYPLRSYSAKAAAVRGAQISILRFSDAAIDPAERAAMEANGVRERMLVPLIVREQVIGVLQIDLRSPLRTFTHRDIRMAQSLGAQAASAIENARLSTETAAQVEQSLIINDISFAISSTMDVADIVNIIREQVTGLTDAREIILALYDSATEQISFPMVVRDNLDMLVGSRPLGKDEISFVIRNRRPLSLGGVNPSAAEVRRNLGIITDDEESARFLGIPLLAGDDVFGALAIRDRDQRRPYGLNEQRILSAIATQLAATLQNARLFARIRSFANELNQRVEERTRELQEERDRLETLYEITSELARTLDADRIYIRSLEMSARAANADAGFVVLYEQPTDQLYTRAALIDGERQLVRTSGGGMTDMLEEKHIPRAPAERFALWLMQHERSTVVADLHSADFWDRTQPGAEEWRSALGVVLELSDEPIGVIVLFARQPGRFSVPQLRLVLAAANQIASTVNNAELYALIREQNDRMSALLRAEQEEAQKNSAILEGIADGVLLADADGVIVLFNRAAATILDIPREYALGRSLTALGDQYASAYRWVSRLTGWSSDPRRSTNELTIDRLEIGARVVSVRAAAVSIGGHPLGTVSVFRDVTRDVEVDRMKSEFISNVSHELRTPMTSIGGYAELLLSGSAGATTDTQRRFLSTIKTNADRLASLVDDLLNISRIDTGRDRLNLQNVDVPEVMALCIETISTRAQNQEKQISLAEEIMPGLPLIRADRLKLMQIVSNILDNAYKYTPTGGAIRVMAEARMEGGRSHVLITIADNGIGIPPEFHDRIFDRFQRYDDNALVMDVAGTGLGLSIVKALVEMHEGDVWFESAVGAGTTFYVSLPVEGPRSIPHSDDRVIRTG
jgi:GAF domain-containing protein/nitrogen-specific signal transduction histidine kinase